MTNLLQAVPSPRTALPLRAGLGLKPEHFRDILEAPPSLGFFEAFLGSSQALSPRRLLEYSSYKLPELIPYSSRVGCGLTVFTRELLTPFINEVPVEVGVLGFGFVLFLVHRPLFLPNLLLPLLIDKGLE